jgi:hypothetical protein
METHNDRTERTGIVAETAIVLIALRDVVDCRISGSMTYTSTRPHLGSYTSGASGCPSLYLIPALTPAMAGPSSKCMAVSCPYLPARLQARPPPALVALLRSRSLSHLCPEIRR